MLRKKFSTTLLALVVAAAMPIGAYAEDTIGETAPSSAPAAVSSPAGSGEVTGGSESVGTPASESQTPSNAQASGGADTTAKGDQTGDSTPASGGQQISQGAESGTVGKPEVKTPEGNSSQGEQTAPPVTNEQQSGAEGKAAPTQQQTATEGQKQVATEGQKQSDTEGQSGVTTQTTPGGAPMVENSTGAAIVPTDATVTTTGGAIVTTGTAIVTTDAAIVTTDAAIVTTDAAIVPAKLTITHRLVVGDQHADEEQVIEGLTVGQELDLTQYLAPVNWVECISNVNMKLDKAESTIVLEYIVKSGEDVDVTIEDGSAIVKKKADEVQPEQYYEPESNGK